jgi:hypothetical protein
MRPNIVDANPFERTQGRIKKRMKSPQCATRGLPCSLSEVRSPNVTAKLGV